MQRAWWIFSVVSLLFFFITAATFSSLGAVLFAMASELHWSLSAAGFSFSLLCLTCGLSSPLPALMMKRIGTRWTMFSGGVILAGAFLLASFSHGLWSFMTATGLMGLGFTLAANIPSVYLLAAWFPDGAERVIGLYFMAGGLGGVFGPPLINGVVQVSGWRAHWLVMAVIAAVIGLLCAVVIEDAVPSQKTAGDPALPSQPPASAVPRTAGAEIMTRQFAIIAVTMLVIQTVVTTVHAMLVAHLASLGSTTTFGALVMSVIGLTDSLAKGAAGTTAGRVGPKRLLIGGIVMLCAAVALLAFASSHVVAFAFAIVLGTGWGASWLAAHLLLLEYFGRHLAAEMISTATLITTAAIAGPVIAGRVADVTGTFVPFFYILAGIMMVTALVCATLRAPASRVVESDARGEGLPTLDLVSQRGELG